MAMDIGQITAPIGAAGERPQVREVIGLSQGGTGRQYRREIGKFLDYDKAFDRKLAGRGWLDSRLYSRRTAAQLVRLCT